MSTRFDLEQKILGCWSIVDDLETFLNHYDNLTEDQRQNILIGLKDLYTLKFQECFDVFEKTLCQP